MSTLDRVLALIDEGLAVAPTDEPAYGCVEANVCVRCRAHADGDAALCEACRGYLACETDDDPLEAPVDDDVDYWLPILTTNETWEPFVWSGPSRVELITATGTGWEDIAWTGLEVSANGYARRGPIHVAGRVAQVNARLVAEVFGVPLRVLVGPVPAKPAHSRHYRRRR